MTSSGGNQSKESDTTHYQFVVIGGGIAGFTCAETVIVYTCLTHLQWLFHHGPGRLDSLIHVKYYIS